MFSASPAPWTIPDGDGRKYPFGPERKVIKTQRKLPSLGYHVIIYLGKL